MTPEQRNAAKKLLLNRLISMAIASVRTAMDYPGMHEVIKADESAMRLMLADTLSPFADDLLGELQELGVMR